MATSSGSWQSWPDGAGVAWVCVGADPDAPDPDGEPAALAGLLGAADSGAAGAESAGVGGGGGAGVGGGLGAGRPDHGGPVGVGAAADPAGVHEVVRPGQVSGGPGDPLRADVVAPGLAVRALVQAE